MLQELLYIADSSDSLRRVRVKRGLDILNKIQKQVDIEVKIIDQDFPKIKEVDAKLVALAKKMEGKIITNDFNLNKVAELQGVPVLNVNQLATALRPVVLPGEQMNVFIQREGKEQGQGVAYLDDGTMVVVENGRRFMGRKTNQKNTSVFHGGLVLAARWPTGNIALFSFSSRFWRNSNLIGGWNMLLP